MNTKKEAYAVVSLFVVLFGFVLAPTRDSSVGGFSTAFGTNHTSGVFGYAA